jgi:predicted phosphodiesterase
MKSSCGGSKLLFSLEGKLNIERRHSKSFYKYPALTEFEGKERNGNAVAKSRRARCHSDKSSGDRFVHFLLTHAGGCHTLAAMLRLVWLFLVLLCSFVGRADGIGLIRVAENWRFFKGTNEPSTPPEAWRAVDFDDSKWPIGQSGFSSVSTSPPEFTSFNDFPTAFSTLYLRKQFTVQDAESVKWLTLRVDYDDGFVAYLNGTEVARRGLAGAPGDFVPFDAAAEKHARGVLEEIDVSPFRNLLQTGTNMFAVQVHNADAANVTMCFAGELLGNILRGPFLANASTNSMMISWRTYFPGDTSVEYGPDPRNLQRVTIDESTTNHTILLTNLAANTKYQYQVRSQTGRIEGLGPLESFNTLESAGPISFVVVGDSGTGGLAQFSVASQMKLAQPEFVIHVGDLIYPGMLPNLLDFRVFSMYGEQMATTPFFFTRGNHDSYYNTNLMLENIYLPTNSTGIPGFYSFDAGQAHFVVLFSNLEIKADYSPGSPQYQWLDQDLAATTKPWKFLFFHHTIRTSSLHRHDDYDFNGLNDMQQLENSFGALATKHGVQVIFNGHDHGYERLAPVGGSMSFVSGGGGAGLYGFAALHPASVQYAARYHCLKVQVDENEVFVQAIDLRGILIDQVHLRREFTPRQTYQAEWNTPLIESKTPDDGDGNIVGERFDFKGSPIPGKPGQFSSPGRLWVNNDKNNIYIGLDEVMATSGKSVFLFLETPNGAGVHSMAPIGNGVRDPDGEGADGLDFLANLAFTNFTPNIGCILGDEMADGTYRSFTPANASVNTGQGIFYLTPELPEVLGARLQQFNRSPQVTAVPVEQNADYIELSIPFDALNGVHPGDTIRVGVVVGLTNVDTSVLAQTREIDSGGICHSLLTNSGITYLEGITVQLARDPDSDGDGLTDAEELALGTDPQKADTDGDGLPDGWERIYLLNPLRADGTFGGAGDFDADGLSNLQEFLAGTNPRRTDTDGDGLPDAWEIKYGLNPTVGVGLDGANADIDGDGYTNLAEFQAGTDPVVPEVLRMSVAAAAAGVYRLSWSSEAGKKYQLQVSHEVGGNYQDFAAAGLPATGTGAPLSFEVPVPTEEGAWFYRVKIVE